jgi:hypothetical protein
MEPHLTLWMVMNTPPNTHLMIKVNEETADTQPRGA